MFNAFKPSKKSPSVPVISALPMPSPDLPTEVVGQIAAMSSDFRDLSAVSVVSRTWKFACNDLMGDVRSIALNCAIAPVVLRKETAMTFAQDFAVQRLLRKSGAKELNPSDSGQLGKNWMSLCKLNSQKPIDQLWRAFVNSKEVDKMTWHSLAEITGKRRALAILAFDPEADAVFAEADRNAIRAEAKASIEKFLDEDPSERISCPGGALRDFANVVAKFGKNTSPPFCSPFHRILFASLTFRPQAFHGLIQLAENCNAIDFFDFSERVKKHFGDNGNVLVSLNLATANWLAKASASDLSQLPLAFLMEAIKQVYRQLLKPKSLSMAQADIVNESRRNCLLGMAKNASALINVIPREEMKYREKLLKPLMKYLKSNTKSDSEFESVRAGLLKQAGEHEWLPKNSLKNL